MPGYKPKTLNKPLTGHRVRLRSEAIDKETGRFMPGNPGGVPKTHQNFMTIVLKEAILVAAEELGSDGRGKQGIIGYLKFIGANYPVAMAGLLGKVLPMTLADPDKPHRGPLSVDEVRRRLAAKGIVVDTIFDAPAELVMPARTNGRLDS